MTDQDSSKPPDRPPGAPKQSGRVAYDSKGNPIWEWETSTGVYDRDVSTQRLRKLEAKLTLEEEDDAMSKPKGLSLQESERLPGGGMNPYDTTGKVADEPAKHPALAHKQVKSAPVSNSLASKYAHAAKTKTAEKKPPPGFWQKLLARFSGK